jgi:hypothetical protein
VCVVCLFVCVCVVRGAQRQVTACCACEWQDLHAVEFFAGDGELSSALVRNGLRCVRFDMRYSREEQAAENAMDLCKPAGFLSAP